MDGHSDRQQLKGAHIAEVPPELRSEDDVPARLHDGLRARLNAGEREGAIDFGVRLRLYLDEHSHRLGEAQEAWYRLTLATEALMYERNLQALTDLYKATGLAAASGRPELAGKAFERIAVIHAAQGRLREAGQVLAAERQRRANDSLLLRLADALCAVEELDPTGGALISSTDFDELPDPYWALLLLGRARWAMAQGGASVALDIAALGRASKKIRPRSLADSVVWTIRATALTAMGDPAAAVTELTGVPLFLTPELELARARADIAAGFSLRALGVIRRLSTSEDAGPSTRAEAMLVGLQSDPSNATTVSAVRALVDINDIRRVITTASPDTARIVWPDTLVLRPSPEVRGLTDPLRGSEIRVLEMLAGTGEMAEIAERLHITKNTLKTHVRAIYRKFGVGSRDAAVAQAYLRGLLMPDVDSY